MHSIQPGELGGGRFEHPYYTFFSRALKFCAGFRDQGRDVALLEEWQRWLRDAERAEIFRHSVTEARSKDFHRQWLQMVVQ